MKRVASGFTLVELLIVVVVIAILAAISVVAFNGIRTRAQIASISDGLTKADKAFQLWAIEEDFATWPVDPITAGGTRFLDLYDTYPSLNNYIQQPPEVIGVHSEDWFYDNEGDIKSECSDPYNGVNIVIRFVPDAQIGQGVDDALDDGNITCGKVRYADQRIFYSLSYDQSVF